jgi:methylated-DNA-protein-cysteine methyltransferase-like protein
MTPVWAGVPHRLRPSVLRHLSKQLMAAKGGNPPITIQSVVAKPNLKAQQTAARIRAAIMRIPRGQVSSYGVVAAAAGLPRGARLVVRVLNQSHGLPWHRVVAAGGRIALPGEHGLDQRFRLEMEGVKFSGRKVRMAEFEFNFRQKQSTSAKRKQSKPAKRKK